MYNAIPVQRARARSPAAAEERASGEARARSFAFHSGQISHNSGLAPAEGAPGVVNSQHGITTR